VNKGNNIPPKRGLCGGTGKQAGLTATMRTLEVGEYIDCPIEWKGGIGAAAQNIGIKLIQRKLAGHPVIRIYRTE
jgi:hypothetical protein